MTEICVCVERGGAVCDKEAISEDAKGRQWVSLGKRRKVDQAASGTDCLYSGTNKTPTRLQRRVGLPLTSRSE